MKKVKIKKITMLFTGLLMCIGVANIVKASSPTVIMDNFENIEMVGKYQLAYATGANVYGWYRDETSSNNIYGEKANQPVRLPGDNGGRITIKDSTSTYYLGGGGNSSASTLAKPSDNAKIARVYLMQIGCVEKGRENLLTDYPMTLVGPKGGSIKANSNTVYVSNYSYNGVGVTITDVTDFVKSQGFGTYQGWDIPYRTRAAQYKFDDYAMWRLIAVCEDDNLPVRMLRLKMGSDMTSGTRVSVDIEGDGVRAKSTGNVTGQLIIAGGGGDTDVCRNSEDQCMLSGGKGSHYTLKPAPSVPAFRLSTGTSGNINRTYNFFEGIVSTDGIPRSDIKALGYRKSDNVPVHNNDLTLMNINGGQNQSANGHNAYFVNNSSKITLTGETVGVNGNLDIIGIVADIDAATYTSSLSHNGKLYQNSDITMKAHIANNTQVNKSNLGVTGGYAEINVDSNITLDTSKITAVYTHNGVQTTLPKSMITVTGNKIKVIFGANAAGKSTRGDALDVTFHGSTKKEQLTLNNQVTMYAPKWVDETGVSHAFGTLTTMTSAKDSMTIAYNNPPVITTTDKEFYENEYTTEQWKTQYRMKDISATDKEDGNITSKIKVVSDSVNPSKYGLYFVKYQVTDRFGKSDTKTATVNVKYNHPPMITVESKTFYENELTLEEWQTEVMKEVFADDQEDGDVTDKIKVIKDSVDPSTPGCYEVTYEVTDSLGKTSQKTIDVTILENWQPVLQIFAGNHRFIEGEYTQKEWEEQIRMTGVSAHDKEDADLTDKVIVTHDTTNTLQHGIYEATYQVTDRWGKTAEKSVKVIVEENKAPEIFASDKYFTTKDTITDVDLLKNVTAIDDRDGDISDDIEIVASEVKEGVVGTYKVTYRVSDQFGKTTEKTVNVHVQDHGSTPPPSTPSLPEDPNALYLWNGRQLAKLTITKEMETSLFDQGAYKDVVFGVYAAEDIVYDGKIVLAKDSLIGISKVNEDKQIQIMLYHAGDYYLQELSTNDRYQLDTNKYYFTFE